MDNSTHHAKNCLISSYRDNFRLDIFYSKTLLFSFWGKRNGPKPNEICKLFSYLNICLHYYFFVSYLLYRCTSVK